MIQETVLKLVQQILQKQNRPIDGISIHSNLREINFRSLDFSELCLKYELQVNRELNFDAAMLRRIETVKDVCDFLEKATH